MNWLLIINDTNCRRELTRFLSLHADSIPLKIEDNNPLQVLEKALSTSKSRPEQDYLVVSSSSSVDVLRVPDIVQCRSYGNYTQLYLAGGKKITSTKGLKEFEKSLEDRLFIRVHQSHLINLRYVEKYVRGSGGYLLLTDGTKIPVAARKKEFLLSKLDKL
ncbi:MAG: DNA-binding response regulator [Bacteroidetes bacterium]|jgi:two-component system LytT family response regulator|nr:DNA-binding response regulator [Bacteroidota bacterium]